MIKRVYTLSQVGAISPIKLLTVGFQDWTAKNLLQWTGRKSKTMILVFSQEKYSVRIRMKLWLQAFPFFTWSLYLKCLRLRKSRIFIPIHNSSFESCLICPLFTQFDPMPIQKFPSSYMRHLRQNIHKINFFTVQLNSWIVWLLIKGFQSAWYDKFWIRQAVAICIPSILSFKV